MIMTMLLAIGALVVRNSGRNGKGRINLIFVEFDKSAVKFMIFESII